MTSPRFTGYLTKSDEQKNREAKQYWEWLNHIRKYSPSAKPLEYDGQLYFTKTEFRKKFKVTEHELKVGIRDGELRGKPIRRITKKAFHEMKGL